MFKKFEEKENISSINNAKNSVVKQIRNKVLEQYPQSETFIDQMIPKKEALKLVKCHEHIELFADNQGDILFFKQREGALFPSLKLLHKYPFMLPRMQVDQGAIRFVLNGSNIMCPGLTSPGARMTKLDKGSVVAVMAEGKTHALAVGQLVMSSEEILTINKGIGVENVHFLNDGLWKLKQIK